MAYDDKKLLKPIIQPCNYVVSLKLASTHMSWDTCDLPDLVLLVILMQVSGFFQPTMQDLNPTVMIRFRNREIREGIRGMGFALVSIHLRNQTNPHYHLVVRLSSEFYLVMSSKLGPVSLLLASSGNTWTKLDSVVRAVEC